MVSKFTDSLRLYCLTIAGSQLSLLYVLFPLTMCIITLFCLPFVMFYMVFLLITKIHNESGFTDYDYERMMVAFDPVTTTTPMASYLYAMESPLDLDYDIGIY